MSRNGRNGRKIIFTYWALLRPVATLPRSTLSNYWSVATKEQSSTTTDSCGQRPQHLRDHRKEIAVVGPHSSLWPKASTFERSQRGVFLVKAPTVHCGQRPQQLRDQRFYYNFDILYNSGNLCIMPGLLLSPLHVRRFPGARVATVMRRIMLVARISIIQT